MVNKILKDTFGYKSFRLSQKEIIDAAMNGSDVLGIMPTGGGKSLCYQVPALALPGLTIVVSPLISLMQDQVLALKDLGVPAEYLNSSLPIAQRRDIEEKLVNQKIKILYVAPEGLLNPSFLNTLKNINVSLVAIDEAHCVSQWGHEFRPQYTQLPQLRQHINSCPWMALTATADKKTQQDICKQLDLKKPKLYVSGFDRPNIKYMIYDKKNEIKQLDDFIKNNHENQTGIVYCLSRKKVERITDQLQGLGYNAVSYHAGLTAQLRAENQHRFTYEENIIVVATIAFGMGIDRPDVRFVAHLDMPKSIESYYQETGRAGRDGAPADAWMVYGLSDLVRLSSMLEMTEASEAYKKIARQKLDAMLGLCETLKCRRQVLLEYFNETYPQPCGYCDVCTEPQETWDATEDVQKLLSAIYRTGQRFGPTHIIDVLRGSKNEKLVNLGHDQLSVHGIGKEYSKSQWNAILRQVLVKGLVRIKDWEFNILSLTEECRPVLTGKTKVYLKPFKKNQKIKNKPKKTFDADIDEELFEKLRQLRKRIADENQVPPYIVFNDKTLQDMCYIKPENKDQMLLVHGVGESKWDKYGESFLKEIHS